MSANFQVPRLRFLLATALIAAMSFSFSPLATAQGTVPNEWTWIEGSSTIPECSYGPPYCGQIGVYGTLGTPAPGNIPGGRTQAVSLTDNEGNFWLFGGWGYDGQGGSGILNDLWEFNTSTSEWVWLGGSSIANNNLDQGVYGTLGMPAAGNMPGDRTNAAAWFDSNGNLWIFGGGGAQTDGQSEWLNDLWEFNPTTMEWTWMGGSSTESPQPNGGDGQPGVYGTLGTPSTGNIPGSRSQAVSWTDSSGNFWLFGGNGFDAAGDESYLNDLWEFNPSTNLWTWMGGSSNIWTLASNGMYRFQYGIYGTLGTPAATNVPGARSNARGWTDSSGNLWLFGGTGMASTDFSGELNDLWKYSPSTNEWTWMGGSNTIPFWGNQTTGVPGVYGTLGVPAATNTPGARDSAVSWVDGSGNLWLYGGEGFDEESNFGMLNDLWVFKPAEKEWTWMSGGSTLPNSNPTNNGWQDKNGNPGVYGTLGAPAATNVPGGRLGAVGWAAKNGSLWLLSGEGLDSAGTVGMLNDFWEYGPSAPVLPPSFVLSANPTWVDAVEQINGGSATSTITSAVRDRFNSAVSLSASGQPAGVSVSFNPTSITGAGTSTMTITAGSAAVLGVYSMTVTGTSGNNSEIATITLIVGTTTPPGTPTFSPPEGTYTAAQSVTISDTSPGVMIFYTTDNTAPSATSKVYSGPITVSSSETIQAIAEGNGYSVSATGVATYTVNYPVTAAPTFSLASGTYGTAQTVAISDATPGATIYYTTDGTAPTVKSAVYGTPITVSSSTTIQAIAVAGTYLNSAIATADYTIWQASVTDEWAWMGGSVTPQPAVYGTLGTPALGNMPSNRDSATTWTDSAGNLWLFGGNGFDSAGKAGDLNDLWKYNPSTNAWAWMGGVSTLNGLPAAPGTPGTLGTPAAGNIPAGRQGAVRWTDAKGNLWLFGGYSYLEEQYYDDLWEFNPSTNEWAWMGGSTTEFNQPGVYGTLGKPAAGNLPGSRMYAVSWTDKEGNLWLFGGNGCDSTGNYGSLNDLWEFNTSTSEWTWMGGSNTISGGKSSVYGKPGTLAAGNFPGSRSAASGWTDSNGNFWLFGGGGYDSAGNSGILNELWEFNPSTNQWAWMGGSNTLPASCAKSIQECGVSGAYGSLQTPSAGNIPGARGAAVSWTDSSGNLWLFGGDGIDSAGKWGYLDDLWEFNPSNNAWTWMSGSSTVLCASIYCGQPGVYGAYQTPAFGNTPGGRANAASWTDGKGNLWLFGGTGVNVTSVWSDFEDLWEFQPASTSLPMTAVPIISLASGTYTTEQFVTTSDSTPGATIYYLIDGVTTVASYTTPIPVTSSETIEAYAVASGFANSTLATATYIMNIPAAAAPAFSVASGIYATAQTVTISDTTPGATVYYTTDGTAPTVNSVVYGTPITVSSSAMVQAIAVANNYLSSPIASAVYTIGSTSTLGEWAWMGGSNAVSAAGQYGTQGVPASGNDPGARSGSVRWTDKDGNLWLYGGSASLSSIEEFEDLWKFTPSTNEWAWIDGRQGLVSIAAMSGMYGTLGTPAARNFPGARSGSASWTDSSGDLWLLGGIGYDSVGKLGELNDLWRYDPPTNLWTWMGGSNQGVLSRYSSYGRPGVYGTLGVFAAGNIPGGRTNAASWIDNSGNFWLFGGVGQDAGGDSVTLNDMWEFSPSMNQWAWMGGSNLLNPDIGSQWGVYGTQGIPAPENIPGSREQAATWTDRSGNFWLFGGSDPFGSGGGNMLNDLWKFNPSTKEWTWMSGPSTIPCTNYAAGTGLFGGYFCGQLSVDGTLGVPAAGNIPGGRAPAAQWIDSSGNLWLFGGLGLDHAGELINGVGVDPGGDFIGPVNDLWYYNPSTNLWTWMGGNTSTSGCVFDGVQGVVCGGQPGIYGTLGTPAGGNIPGSRTSAVSWSDKSGNLWLFSGWGQGNNFFSDVETYPLNDVWEYRSSTDTLPATPTPVFGTAPGTYDSGGPVTIFDAMPNAVIHFTTDGTTPTTASTLYSGPVTVSSSETLQAIASASGYGNSGVASAAYVITPPAATPVFSVPAGAYTTPQTVTITDATPGATISYSTDGGTTMIQYTNPIVVSSTETLEAIATAPGYSNSAMVTAAYTIGNPANSAPTISGISPAFTSAGGAAFTLTVTGSGFTSGSTAYWGTYALTTTYGSATQLTAQVPAADIASGGNSVGITVQAPSPGGGPSNAFQFEVDSSSGTTTGPIFTSTAATVSAGSSASYPVTFPSSVESVSATCLNLPAGASCSYSATTNTLTITTSSTTPKGTYQVTTVFSETVSAVVASWIMFPVLLLPLMFLRKKLAARSIWITAGIGLVLIAAAACTVGCGGGGGGTTTTPISQTYQAVSSGSISITIQ